MNRVPLLRRYYETLRLPVVPPTALRCLRLVVPFLTPVFVSPLRPDVGREARSFRLWLLQTPAFKEMETTGSPRFLENPDVLLPCSLTPAGPTHQAITMRRHGPRSQYVEGSQQLINFGALSHGFGTRCLRFARWVARTGRKTRFWVLAKLSQAGLTTRRVPSKGFNAASYIISPFPKLRLAQTGSIPHPSGAVT